jgi:hypothetical protein
MSSNFQEHSSGTAIADGTILHLLEHVKRSSIYAIRARMMYGYLSGVIVRKYGISYEEYAWWLSKDDDPDELQDL